MLDRMRLCLAVSAHCTYDDRDRHSEYCNGQGKHQTNNFAALRHSARRTLDKSCAAEQGDADQIGAIATERGKYAERKPPAGPGWVHLRYRDYAQDYKRSAPNYHANANK